MAIELPPSTEAQEAAWGALFNIHERLTYGWTLVGGQSVYLHAVERESISVRPTDDADTVLDIREHPNMLATFTGLLVELGFKSAGFSPDGHEHRWVREEAKIDVLIPRFLGERAEKRGGVNGGTTLAAPAGQTAVNRTETVEVVCGDRTGSVNRPTLMGCLIGKAAAIKIMEDPGRKRHFDDFLIMASVVRAADVRGIEYSHAERGHLSNMLGHLANKPELAAEYPESNDGVARLRISLYS
ncbi:hypothetical protein GCM10027403_36540 [Arthrobacter tecti]